MNVDSVGMLSALHINLVKSAFWPFGDVIWAYDFGHLIASFGHLIMSFGHLMISLGHLVMPFWHLMMSFGHLGIWWCHLASFMMSFGHLVMSFEHLIMPFVHLIMSFGGLVFNPVRFLVGPLWLWSSEHPVRSQNPRITEEGSIGGDRIDDCHASPARHESIKAG